MVVLNAVEFVVAVAGVGHSVQTHSALTATEAARVVDLPERPQHLHRVQLSAHAHMNSVVPLQLSIHVLIKKHVHVYTQCFPQDK